MDEVYMVLTDSCKPKIEMVFTDSKAAYRFSAYLDSIGISSYVERHEVRNKFKEPTNAISD